MDRIEFTIPWYIAPKQSARFGRRRAYQTEKIKGNAAALAFYAQQHCPDEPWDCAVGVSIDVEYPWRAKDSTKRRALGVVPKTTPPDCEQLSKQLCDVLEDVGFFTDDARVAESHVTKAWTGLSVVHVKIWKL